MKTIKLHIVNVVFLVLATVGCDRLDPNQNEAKDKDDLSTIKFSYKNVKLNTNAGYQLNQVTGDSILPIINSFGNTVITGKPIPVNGKVIHPDSVAQPKIITAGEPTVVPTHLNVHKIPENLTRVPVNIDSLKTFTTGSYTSSFVLVNSTGDTIPTGVPIPIEGRVVPAVQTQPVRALPPGTKDNANINIKYLDVEQGMNSSEIRTILEDSRGNLWFGTAGNGVSKFNGNSFTNYTMEEGLINNSIFSAIEDNRGNLWFATSGGLSMYNGETFTNFTEKEGLSNHKVTSIIEDRHGNLWFCSPNRSVSKLVLNEDKAQNGGTITHFAEKEGLSNNMVFPIFEDSRGNLWFGTARNGVIMYNGQTFIHFTDMGLSNAVNSILEDRHGNLWFGSFGGGVSKLVLNGAEAHNSYITHYTEKDGLSSNKVNSIHEDGYGNLWVGTDDAGVNKIVLNGAEAHNSNSITHYTEKEGLSRNVVYPIFEDSHGNLWFGTFGGGVNIYKDNFIHFKEKEGLFSKGVSSIFEDHLGNLWFGTRGGGVSMYNGSSFTNYTEKEGLSGDDVKSIFEDSHGIFWFGTFGNGMSRYDGKSFTHFTEEEGLINNNVWSIVEDRHGNLWLSSYMGGVSIYDDDSFTHFTEKGGLSDNNVEAIIEDRQGDLWFSSFGGGISKLVLDGAEIHNSNITHFTEKEGLSNNKVFPIFEDGQGNMWYGTSNKGVGRLIPSGTEEYNGSDLPAVSPMDKQRQAGFTHFTKKEGLSNNTVWSIIEDSNNNIWVGTASGLYLLAFGPDNSSNALSNLSSSEVKRESLTNKFNKPLIHAFDKQDGIKDMIFIRNSVLLDSKNRLWWGTNTGLTVLDMNNFELPVETPTMQLDLLEINEQFLDYRHLKDSTDMKMEFDGVAKFYNYPLNLELPYFKNHLTLHFSAIDWYAPHKIRYSYKIEELDNIWSPPTPEPKASYPSLPHGNYTFKVRAIGATQKWSEPFEYTFIILPPWWHTWWARIGYVITGIFLLIGFVRFRTRSIERQKKTLESIVVERTATIVAQKEEIESTFKELQQTQTQLVQSEKMASLGVLTAGIAHEINNPINFISAGTNTLERDFKDLIAIINGLKDIPEGGEQFIEKTKVLNELKEKHYFDDILQAIPQTIEDINVGVKRTNEIVKGLMLYSRSEGEQLQRADIHESIDSAILLLNDKHKHRIEIIKNYKSRIKKINCYPGQLNQVFVNLLDNAIDAIGDKGTITIGTRSKNDEVVISIQDTGTGITDEILTKIFDPFFTTKPVGKGTGLGLSICQGIIKKHKGRIEVESEVREGTSMKIYLRR